MNVLVVEDEHDLAESICHILEKSGFQAEPAFDGKEGLSLALGGMFDAVVLDVMLPELDGISLVRELRAKGSAIPVLMLTARSTTLDKVTGLNSGADDYMTKPFENVELVARVRALTRRQGEVIMDQIAFEDLTLKLDTHDLSVPGSSVHLSQKEFDVMRVLMGASGRVVSKQDLLTRAWSMDGEASENSVEAYVSFLRKKLAHLGSRVRIVTLRMLGYRLGVSEDS